MRRLILGFASALLGIMFCSAPTWAQDPPQPTMPNRTASSPINLNTATQSQLETLPGIGARTAERIIEYREKNNGFKKVEELMNIRGIGEKSFLKLKPLVSVGPPRSATQQ
jgi:competence protein ComEA